MIKELESKIFWISGDWSYSDDCMKPYKTWLMENCSEYKIEERWHNTRDFEDLKKFIGILIYFKHEKDAIAFKLRWI